MTTLATFTNLPIGIYILNGSTYVNTSGSAFGVNMQFGTSAGIQNGNLQNLQTYSYAAGSVIMLTTIWIQTSVVNVYFSASGSAAYPFENICATYLRIV
jgi:hypothetical protein